VLPTGIVSTGWPAVRDKCASFGVEFDPWQDGAGRVILSKRADGSYACSIGGVVMSIPRQVGKTFLIGAIVFALCLLHPGLTVLWTAHRLRTANETFAKMQAFSRRRKVAPHMLKPILGAGEATIRFRNGSRILFGARERGFGRGFDNVDIEVFDEAQILTENAIDDMVPATNTAANPLLLFTGTPPKPTDPADVFKMKRDDALGGDSDDMAYLEFSADEGCQSTDRKQWAKANPSYPYRTPDAAMLRMKKNLTAESFVREALGVWDSKPEGGVIPNWLDLTDESSVITSGWAWALSVSPIELGPQWSAIGVAGRRDDGDFHMEWMEHRQGTAWVVPYCKAAYDSKQIPLRVHKGGPESALISRLIEAGVEVDEVSTADAARATGLVIAAAKGEPIENEDGEMVIVPGLRHLGQPSLNMAVKNAVLRIGVDGAVVLSQRKSSIEITPFMACTVAAGGVPVLSPVPAMYF
jgi:hypothetical protein